MRIDGFSPVPEGLWSKVSSDMMVDAIAKELVERGGQVSRETAVGM